MKKRLKQIGVFRNTERGYGFIDFDEDDKESVFIAHNMMKDALNGDTVEFIITVPKRRAEEELKGKF